MTLPEKRLARQGTLQRDLNTLIDHVAGMGGGGATDHIENASNEGVYVDADGTVTVILGDSAGVEKLIVKDKSGATVATVDSDGVVTADIDHNTLTNTHNLTTDIDHAALTNAHNLTTDIDHDALTNFLAAEHVDWAATGPEVVHADRLVEGLVTDHIENASSEGVYVDADGTVTVVLGDAAGVQKLVIKDKGGVTVASLDSDGKLRVVGKVTVQAPAEYLPWWDLGDGSCLGAWQAVGSVASLAASKVDLTGKGNDLSGGVDPGWNETTGWNWNGSTQYLQTGITLLANYTIIYRFTGVATTYGAVMGVFRSGAAMCFYPDYYNDHRYMYGYASADRGVAAVTGGVMAMAGEQPYLNGAADGAALATQWASGNQDTCYIGGANGGIAKSLCLHKSQAAAIYNRKLTAAEIATISANIATLTGSVAPKLLVIETMGGEEVARVSSDGSLRFFGALTVRRNAADYAARALVACGTAKVASDTALTTSYADLVTKTETVPAGQIVLTACLTLEGRALDATNDISLRLYCDGNVVDDTIVALQTVDQCMRVMLTWSGSIAAGSKIWKVMGLNAQDDASNDAYVNANSILSWQVYA